MHPMAAVDTQLMGYLFDIINEFPASVRYDDVNNYFEVASDIAISGNAFGFQDSVYNASNFFSRAIPIQTYLVEQRIEYNGPRVRDIFKPHDYGKYLRNNALNNNMVDGFYSSILRAPTAMKQMLQRVVSQQISCNNSVCDNSSIYFKLFMNCFIRSRLYIANMNPRMPGDFNNSTFEYCNVNNPAQFSEENITRYCADQFMSFFQSRCSSLDWITMMEILGCQSPYFRSTVDNLVLPTNRISWYQCGLLLYF